MVVISDTSPLNYLILIDLIDILPAIFQQVTVPAEVIKELLHPRAPGEVRAWASAPPSWIVVKTPQSLPAFGVTLDPGESQAIALALELKVSLLAIDERKGRQVAKSLGLTTIGLIAILEMGADLGLLDLPKSLDSLLQTNFHISRGVVDEILRHRASRPDSGFPKTS